MQSVHFKLSRILSSESAESDQKFVNHGLSSWNRSEVASLGAGPTQRLDSDVPTWSKNQNQPEVIILVLTKRIVASEEEN